MPPRILILTASVGAGHDLPAERLATQLRKEQPAAEVEIDDCLQAMGWAVAAISESAPRTFFYRFRWFWDVGFWFITGSRLTRALAQRALMQFGAPGLLRLIEARQPDVIVSVYPGGTEVLGRLRRAGRIRVPVVAVITDIAALHYWASRGIDLHLVTHPESIPEVRTIVGNSAAVHCVHGFALPEYREPRETEAARRALGLPEHGTIVLVSGGGWGVGDVAGAAETALDVVGVELVVCLCGHNAALRSELERRFANHRRVCVEGFTEFMPDWLAAGDALVHSTGGLTVLEALMRGCPAISYGWGRGHVRLHNAAFRRHRLAAVASSRAELADAIAAAVAAGRTAPYGLGPLPSAASLVLAAADAC